MRILGPKDTLGTLGKALDVAVFRGKLIAANVAHAETPNYKAADLDFSKVLSAVEGTGEIALAKTNPMHLSTETSGPLVPIRYKMQPTGEPRADGNTVNLEEELIKLAGNQIRFHALVQAINRVFSNLKEAVTEGGRR